MRLGMRDTDRCIRVRAWFEHYTEFTVNKFDKYECSSLIFYFSSNFSNYSFIRKRFVLDHWLHVDSQITDTSNTANKCHW